MEHEQLPKLLDIGTKDLVSLDRIALVLVIFPLGREISRLVGVGGDANVLQNALQISTLSSFFSDGRGCKCSLRTFSCSLEHHTKIRANWVGSRIVEGELNGIVLLLVMPY